MSSQPYNNKDEPITPDNRSKTGNLDSLAANTTTLDRFAYHIGDRTPDSNWSIVEQWVADARSHVVRSNRHYFDAMNTRGGLGVEIKTTQTQHRNRQPGKFVIRNDQHSTLLAAPNNPSEENYYHLIVKEPLNDNIVYMAGDTTVTASQMDELLSERSWTTWTRGDNERANAQISWTEIPGFTTEISHRAELVRDIYSVIRGRSATQVKSVIDDFSDLLKILKVHDQSRLP